MKSNKHGLVRILNAFKYSFNGFVAVLKSEEAFRQDLLLCFILTIIVFLLPILCIEKLFLFSSLFLIIMMELVNTAFEMVIDRISDDYHELSKITKDIGSCLVLISFIYLFLVWGIILWKNFV